MSNLLGKPFGPAAVVRGISAALSPRAAPETPAPRAPTYATGS